MEIDKKALVQEWESHVSTILKDANVVRVDDVRAWFEARGVSDVLSGPHRHAAYTPLYKSGFRKMRRGDFVRAEQVQHLEEKPHCPSIRSAIQRVQPEASELDGADLVLCGEFDDGEPRVRDLDLAAFLGFERPRVIRELIERHSEALGVRRTVRRTEKIGISSRAVEDQYLTERQALKVLRWCDTAKADECYDHIVDVFLAWRRGRLGTAAPLAPVDHAPSELYMQLQEIASVAVASITSSTKAISECTSVMRDCASISSRVTALLEQTSAIVAMAVSPSTPAAKAAPLPSPVEPVGPPPWDYIRGHKPPPGFATSKAFLWGKQSVSRKTFGQRVKEISIERGLPAYETRGRKYPDRFWSLSAMKDAYNEMVGARQ